MPEERLQKILAQAGISSRRKAEELIVEGRVTVNGEVVKELGSKADPEKDAIKVDGTLVHLRKRHVYIALNKPREVVTTVSDPQGRTTVMHLLKGVKERVFPVGRLDYHSEGLLLLTTDGEFANRITSPAGHVEKVYVVKANGFLSEEQVDAFEAGIPLSGRRTAPAKIKLIKRSVNPWYEVRLTEGRQNQIRIMFTHFHRLVEKLRRVKIGFLTLGGLPPGMWRYLTAEEVEQFHRMISRSEAESQRRARKPLAAGEEGRGEAARREYPVLPKERFRRPKYHPPEERETQDAPRGGDRPITRRPTTPRPEFERPAAQPREERFERPAAGSRGPRPGEQAGRDSRRPDSQRFGGPKSKESSFQRPPSNRPPFKRSDSRAASGPQSDRPTRRASDRPEWKKPDSRSAEGPRSDRPSFNQPASGRPPSDRRGPRSYADGKSGGQRSEAPRPKGPGSRPFGGPKSEKPFSDRPGFDRRGDGRPSSNRPGSNRSSSERSGSGRPGSRRPQGRKPGPRRSDDR